LSWYTFLLFVHDSGAVVAGMLVYWRNRVAVSRAVPAAA
jgi:hypothetical protein